MVDIGTKNPNNTSLHKEYCSSISRLSELAETFIFEDGSRENSKNKSMKFLLQECVDTLSNYKDECKKLKRLQTDSSIDINDKSRIFEIYESAYIYYKIVHIIILNRIPTLSEFQTIKNDKSNRKNQELMEIYNTLVSALAKDENIAQIKNFIKHHASNEELKNSDYNKYRNDIIKNLHLPSNGSFISTIQLNELMRNFNDSLLIIDIRSRSEFIKSHIKSKNIICIEPISFKDSYSDYELERKSIITSPNNEIRLFNNRQSFKFIVLYTEILDTKNKNNSHFYNERQILLLNILLKRSFEKPLNECTGIFVLNNGFSNWVAKGGELESFEAKSNGLPSTDDSVYINGNTSRLSLQNLPKMSPSIGTTSMDKSFHAMMSSSPSVTNDSYIQQPTVKRTSSFKNFFPPLAQLKSPNNVATNSVPQLTIRSKLNSPMYSNSISTLSLATPGPSSTDFKTATNHTLYPDTPQLKPSHDTNHAISPSHSYDKNSPDHVGILTKNITPISARCVSPSLRSRSPSTNLKNNRNTAFNSVPSFPTVLSSGATTSLINGKDSIPKPPTQSLPRLPALPTKPVISSNLASPPHSKSNNGRSAQVYTDALKLDFIVGLENMGNSCYMNCIIQCILGTHDLIKIFLNNSYEKHINLSSRLGSKGVLAKNFARLIHTMYMHAVPSTINKHTEKKIVPVKPYQFKLACGSINSLFRDSQQQDSQEFCQFLLDGLHEDLNQCGGNPPLKELSLEAERLRENLSLRIASSIEWERYLTTDFSVIVDLFQGQYASRLECKVCHHTSTTYQSFSVLSVPLPKKFDPQTRKIDLIDCFNEFTKIENLEVDEQWSCPTCKKKQPSTKKLTITRLPRNLIIHLKRFDNMLNKNNSFIDYPFNLDLTEFWADDFDGNLPPGVSNELPARGQIKPFNYRLYGVACHFGSLYGGHYTAYVDKGIGNGWYYFDDTTYRPLKNDKEPISSSAYVLFYTRVYGVR
ncbi:hypothetical protein KAFR_0C02590 [Kazachstania africana CBS 2517]|uniref:Ubiquitin carboxyl-terminal hydrolase n=1 Tax=Kazachstania africana (strain ATCC 22294 / BCRC 22015 / CBS 2517 / CECT 1963 / NBRC 1671 / NRRL Y-8276) TaxID=1071382 RepID=H2ASA2_KAZAF|nr:hypothetical protein KAFR_0C02590 [Kazachstania africana CBS 2517]CCF57252.1 hypothetical protein KAFR_0C02590 [Kazachstania africana CBS 2517]